MPKCKRSGHADKEDEDSRGADVCDSYGWSFPNPNPSDRRSHKRVCGTNEGDRPGNDDAPHKIHLDVEHVSDPNAAPTGMCVAESSVDGAIQPMTSEENNHSDETKHIAENPNPNDQSTNEYFESLKRGFALARAMNEVFFRIKDKANMKASECEVKVKINEDTTLRVVPRIKLNFTFGCAKGDIGGLMSECQVKKIIINKLRLPRHDIFLTLFDDDVHVHYASEPKWTNDGDMFVVAKGFVFIRDSKILKNKKAVGRNRDYFLKKMSTCTTNFPNAIYKIRLSLPSGEDAKRMMKLDVFGDEVFIQFEDYYKPLQLLCSSSLQKEGSDLR